MKLKLVGVSIIFFLFLFEITSFLFSYFNLLPVNDIPKLYLNSNYDNFRNEKYVWGAWHKPNIKVRHKSSCFDVEYSTNSFGAKDYEFNQNKEDRKRFLLIGDSFAEGYGVSNKETLKSYIEQKSNFQVYNFGSAGAFGPLQYYLIYENLAKKFYHDSIIITFLPANDFHENDYNYWNKKKWNLIDGNFERYRPYYKKVGNSFDYFIPENAKKRENWNHLDNQNLNDFIKRFIKDNLWSFNLYKSLNLAKNYSNKKSKKKYSGFFDSKQVQQEAAIFYIKKLLNYKNFDEKVIIIIPTVEDLKRIYLEGKIVQDQFWYKEFQKLESEYFNTKIINIHEFVDSVNDYKKYINKCDGHMNSIGNKFLADLTVNAINQLKNK